MATERTVFIVKHLHGKRKWSKLFQTDHVSPNYMEVTDRNDG